MRGAAAAAEGMSSEDCRTPSRAERAQSRSRSVRNTCGGGDDPGLGTVRVRGQELQHAGIGWSGLYRELSSNKMALITSDCGTI